jgi:hypothetical protein
MGVVPKRVCWEACTWIALIQKEKVTLPNGSIEDRETMCRMVIEAAKKNDFEILSSYLCLSEVCKVPQTKGKTKIITNKTKRSKAIKTVSDKLADYFETDYVLLANVDRAVSERASLTESDGRRGCREESCIW